VTHLEDRIGYGDESERGHDDFVALADAQGEQSKVQASGAGADADGMGHGVVGGQCCLKRRQFGTHAEVRRAQNGGDGVDLGLGDVGAGQLNHLMLICISLSIQPILYHVMFEVRILQVDLSGTRQHSRQFSSRWN
jgi:hypothetical protein